jgi:23S rRNA (uracil1939-C5)-methyltransferase
MIERLIVTQLGHRGDGVVDSDAGPIYVPYTLPGETVEVEAWPRHPDRRQLLRVESASCERITPICPHFGVCGGCALQHWNWTEYIAWKHDLVRTALQQSGLDAPVDDLIDAHGDGRRRAVFHARGGTHGVLAVGFAAAHQHHIVPIDRCPVLAPGLDGALTAAWAIAQELEPLKKPLDIAVTASETGLDVDVRGSGPLPPRVASALAVVAERHRLARLTRHGELVVQRAAPVISMGSARVELPPGAFLQATTEGEAALARAVLAHLGNVKLVVDLFCGLGPFALRIAERARVIAADTDADAIAALTKAARTPGLRPVAATARDLFRRPFVAEELRGAGVVVFDPPRQGAQAQARALATSKVPLVIAVSCNAATFARDIKILVDGGYKLKAVTPIDQFRYSPHVEIVARLER